MIAVPLAQKAAKLITGKSANLVKCSEGTGARSIENENR